VNPTWVGSYVCRRLRGGGVGVWAVSVVVWYVEGGRREASLGAVDAVGSVVDVFCDVMMVGSPVVRATVVRLDLVVLVVVVAVWISACCPVWRQGISSIHYQGRNGPRTSSVRPSQYTG
jgi:hypothetical protein